MLLVMHLLVQYYGSIEVASGEVPYPAAYGLGAEWTTLAAMADYTPANENPRRQQTRAEASVGFDARESDGKTDSGAGNDSRDGVSDGGRDSVGNGISRGYNGSSSGGNSTGPTPRYVFTVLSDETQKKV